MKTTTNTAAQVEAHNTALKNSNNNVNQEIKGKFIGQHVNMCLSYLMDELFKASSHVSNSIADLPTYEDVVNLFSYPEYSGEYAQFDGGSYDELQAEIEILNDLLNDCSEDEAEAIQDEIQALEDLQSEPQEVYEWWAVTEYLFERLKAQGEPVLEYANMYIWGRCTTGQAILLDYSITKICADMEILEGQSNSWAK